MSLPISRLAGEQVDFLLFRPFKPDLGEHFSAYLGWGMAMTWLAGMGRYWDNPNAALWQKAGLGSIGYVLVMAWLIWLITLPLQPRNWSYRNVLVFVTLTSAPAILYATPVEKFMSLGAAQTMNGLFLFTVATWRVALLVSFLRRAAGLSGLAVSVATLLPLGLIVTVLSILNLEGAVFEIMGGFEPGTAYDAAYGIVVTIMILAWISTPLLIAVYCGLIIKARKAGVGKS